MANSPCMATILGIPTLPNIKEVNVRPGPTTDSEIAFKAPIGMSGLEILDVQPDSANNGKDGKIYQWFKLTFHGGAVGWVRDDLLLIQGECGQWGYPALSADVQPFALTRGAAESASTKSETVKTEISRPAGTPSARSSSGATIDSVDRVKKAAFQITATFEGTGYAAYNNYDAGIVSYGLIQFTLAAGSLNSVLTKYLAKSTSDTANNLRKYSDAVANRDPNLRSNNEFRDLLKTAAAEPEMQAAQDSVATEKYWDAVVNGYIVARDLQTPLTWALLFDMGVNFGTGHGFVRKAEEELGVPSRSKPGENGITEEQLITRVAELRRDSHYRQAERDNLPGLKRRGDFWINLIQAGDWALQGDDKGNVNVNGKLIQVRNP